MTIELAEAGGEHKGGFFLPLLVHHGYRGGEFQDELAAGPQARILTADFEPG